MTGGEAELAGTAQAPDSGTLLVTERWQWRGDAALTYELRESRDDGATWMSLVRAELAREASAQP